MSNISKIIGERIRNYRNREKMSQEELAEKCGLHTTYIGQLERGEKNATLESIGKVINGLNINFEMLFEKISDFENKPSTASQCYLLIDSLSEDEQIAIFELIQKIVAYKKI